MEHVVFFPAQDGSPAFRRVAGLEEAVRLVEHLRNVENVSEVSVHALSEVPLAFKTWYRVEVPPAEAPGEVATAVAAEVVEMSVDAPAPDVPALDVPSVEVPSVEVPEQPGPAPESARPSSLGFFSR